MINIVKEITIDMGKTIIEVSNEEEFAWKESIHILQVQLRLEK